MTIPSLVAALIIIAAIGSFAMAIIGMFKDDCQHKWGKWVDSIGVYNISDGSKREVQIQYKNCELCGMKKTRDLQ